MAKRPISADDLGELGESKFQQLCATAGLIANKSSRDKMGWDYILERAPGDEIGTSLDARRPFPLCRVQVKTVWKRAARRISLSLSSAERLAKPYDPAFIIGFEAEEIGDDVHIVSATLIHLRGGVLSRVLQRLRAISAGKTTKMLDEQEITFDLTKGAGIATGTRLLTALCDAIGPDADAYRQAKRDELKTLGYDGPAYRVDLTLIADDGAHVVDALLGRRAVEVRGANAVDRRYGMDVPSGHAWEPGQGQRLVATFLPAPQGHCQIVVRGDNGGSPIGLEGTFVSLPSGASTGGDAIILFSTELFELEVRESGRVALTIGGSRVQSARLPLAAWRRLVGVLGLVVAGPTTFEISDRSSNARMEIPLSPAPSSEQAGFGAALEAVLDQIDKLWGEAGAPVPNLTQRDLLEIEAPIDVLHRFWRGELLEPASFPIPAGAPGAAAEITMVRVMSVVLADSHLAVAELVFMRGTDEDGEHVYRQHDRRVAKVEQIGMLDDAVASFADRVRHKNDAHGIMTLVDEPAVQP